MKEKGKKLMIVAMGIVINVVGRYIANYFKLPIWFDMVGTVLVTYYVGLWGGIATGLANNILSACYDVTALLYGLTGVVAALLMYRFIQRGYMNRLLKAVISSFWLGVVCMLVSTPINIIFYDGYSGNIWGDALVDMLKWYDASDVVAALAGEAVVEIVDKQVCVLLTFLIIYLVEKAKKSGKNKAQTIAAVLLFTVILSWITSPMSIYAAESNTEENFVEKVYDNTNGMVSSEANIICETEDGYIWVGSYAGLSRYDGNKFEFIREGGLVNVVGMMTDSKGRLWIGTNDAGIARYENGTYTYFTTEEGLPSNSVRCFAEDSAGNIYVGTSDQLCKFGADDSIEILDTDITFQKSMLVYEDKLIVMDNTGGLYALDGTNQLTVSDPAMEQYFYYCMTVTENGLLVGTETGELFIFEIDETGLVCKEKITLGVKQISAVFEDSKGRVWVATDEGFGYLTGKDRYHAMDVEGFETDIDCFLEDYQGNIWIASPYYGVMKLSESAFVNLFEKANIENELVNAIVFYQGNYYCGTDNGLVILNGKTMGNQMNDLTAAMEGYRIRGMYVDSANRLWLCTYNGLICTDGKNELERYTMEANGATSDRFRCMTELSDGTLVTGTADGINFIKDGNLTGTLTAEDGLANTQILSIVEGKDGRVWAGSDGSGIYLIEDGKLVDNYTTENGLSSDVILRIVPYDEGYLVVTSNALCHIDLQGQIRRLENFPYFNNYDIILNGEMAYVTCSSGLYEVKLDELCADNAKQYKLYGANAGLLYGLTANSWNYVSEDGSMYLCSNSGVISFSETSDEALTNIKYGMVSVECDGNMLEATEEGNYVIPANANEVTVHASVRNFAFTDVTVRFYVKELEESPKAYAWDEIESIHIFKPDATQYTICMEILDGAGETVIEEKTYTLGKEARMWEQSYYQTYLVFVTLEIIFFVIVSILAMILFVVRKNELERHQIELEEKVREQTKTINDHFVETVTALSEAVDAKDRYTSGHSKRVAEYARLIAIRLGKSKKEQEEIYRAGLLHDVGKIRIPVDIINKPGKLTDEEYNLIKLHPVTGYHILRGISGSENIAIATKYHHERYDGKGYPNGLAGEKIPEVARILGVADSYDAMTSNRSYRNALPQGVVRSEIEKGRGTQFDPVIADIMLEMMDEDIHYTMKQADATHKKILSVDDDEVNNRVIANILKDEPLYDVETALSGAEALELLDKKHFDLIMLDVNMPEMDGLQTLREIRKKYDTPVVLMTADLTLDTSTEFAELGCDDYVTKPFLPLLIKEVVHNMLERTNVEGN